MRGHVSDTFSRPRTPVEEYSDNDSPLVNVGIHASRTSSSPESVAQYGSPHRWGRLHEVIAAQPAVQVVSEDVRAILAGTYRAVATLVPDGHDEPKPMSVEERM